MAKRFTASDKWKDTWFSNLDDKQRLFWLYLLDDCDCAGIWEKNFKAASYFIGGKLTEEWAIKFLIDKVYNCNGSKWFIPKFIDFQYGELSESCNPHKAVIRQLRKYGLYEGYLKGTYGTLEDKDKEQVQDQDEDKDKDKEQEQPGADESPPENPPPDKPTKEKYGDDVFLTVEEHEKLLIHFVTEERRAAAINILDIYLGQSAKNKKKYTSHYKVLLGWVTEEIRKRESNGSKTNKYSYAVKGAGGATTIEDINETLRRTRVRRGE